MHRAYCVKPTEEWRSISLHRVSAQLSHKTLESFANHPLGSGRRHPPQQQNLRIHNRRSHFLTPSIFQKKKPLHHISTPNITPHEASMAFEKTNKHKRDNPNDLIGHRGSVYIVWVTERHDTADTFLGIFCLWKDCKQVAHSVSNAGYNKEKNLSRAFEKYPRLLKYFMADYHTALKAPTLETT
eukprot:9027490-Ditylum_brightwellii.AAC.1